jgi:2-polyprenyl-3-methyl-5-hydroxy-6-metoxy-1,4-benzoquinol methylase
MKCKICDGTVRELFVKKVLRKHDVAYFQCSVCRFIQTEEPYWLGEAYKSAIAQLDVGLVWRAERLTPIVSSLIRTFFPDRGARFLDYGGGYGLFVRMMRDRGFDFYRQDRHCENIFADRFDLTDLPAGSKFAMVTAFEVVEHLPDPVAELESMLQLSDTILLTTELQPENAAALSGWRYFAPETGQHISLLHRDSLAALARRLGLHVLTRKDIHLLSKTGRSAFFYRMAFRPRFQKLMRKLRKRKSLLLRDAEKIRSMGNAENR